MMMIKSMIKIMIVIRMFIIMMSVQLLSSCGCGLSWVCPMPARYCRGCPAPSSSPRWMERVNGPCLRQPGRRRRGVYGTFGDFLGHLGNHQYFQLLSSQVRWTPQAAWQEEEGCIWDILGIFWDFWEIVLCFPSPSPCPD